MKFISAGISFPFSGRFLLMQVYHHGSEGGSPGSSALRLHLGEGLLLQLCPVARVYQVASHLPVLGKVEGGNLLSLLDLLLVGLHLALQLLDQALHPFVVLPVLLLSVGQLLDLALRPAEVLLGISKAAVLSIQFTAELPDPSVHLGHGLLARFQGILLSLIQTCLSVFDLSLEELVVPLKQHGHILFTAEFISKPCSINHGPLSLVLGHGSLGTHLIQVMGEAAHLLLALLPGSHEGLVGAGGVSEGLVGVSKLSLGIPPVPVSLLQQGPGFLKGILVSVAAAVSSDQVVLGSGTGLGLLLQSLLDLPDLGLDL